jgi:hypothetical protein
MVTPQALAKAAILRASVKPPQRAMSGWIMWKRDALKLFNWLKYRMMT